jgi:cytochrome c biogenesis protein CcmG, thiol:disulfide interchange protein DsbE
VKRGLWNLLIGVALLVGFAWIWAGRVPSSAAANGAALSPAPAVGHPAPEFALRSATGESISLAALRGRPVVLNFWATWCPPCRAEAPELQSASLRYAGQVAVIGVDQSEPASTVQTYTAQQGLTYPSPLDENGQVSQAYGVHALPTTFFIDRDGLIRQIYVGPLSGPLLAQMLGTVYP